MASNQNKKIMDDCPARNTRSRKNAIVEETPSIVEEESDKKKTVKTAFVEFLNACVAEKSSDGSDDDAGSYASWMEDYDEEEVEYLKELEEKEREKIITEEKDLLLKFRGKVPQRFKILHNTDLPDNIKHLAIQKIRRLIAMDESDDARPNMEEWIEKLCSIPFSKFVESKMSKENSIEEIVEHFKKSQARLNEVVYGHEDTKAQILEYIANSITNPRSNGKCLAIQGPPGNGKTTIMRYGLADVLGRPFYQINLGGLREVSALTGGAAMYIGSTVGKILQALCETQCMNPVILFDELDKVESDAIFNVLCHITDYTQNSTFSDRYLDEVKIDLSKVTFVFTFNDIKAIHPVLLDRLHVIQTDGFNSNQKVHVAKGYLLPKIFESYGFDKDAINFSDEVISKIIHDHCGAEKGVRSLQRYLEGIVSKINLIRLTGGSINLPYSINRSFEFPMSVDYKLASDFIKSQKDEKKFLTMYN